MERFISNFNKDLTDALFPSQGKTARTDALFRPSAPPRAKKQSSDEMLAKNEPKAVPVMAQTAPPAIFRDKSGDGTQFQSDGTQEPVSELAPQQGESASAPAVDQRFPAQENDAPPSEPEEGYLVVQVFTARSSIPLQGAEVTITTTQSDGGEHLMISAETNESGRTQIFALPTPPISESEHPGGPRPYSVYNVRVAYPGFYITELRDVPVFPDRTSVQPINMIPFVEGSDPTRVMTCPESRAMCSGEEE